MYFCGWKGLNVTRSLNPGRCASFIKMQFSFPWGFIQILSCFHRSKGYDQNGFQNMHLFMWRNKRNKSLSSFTLKENPAALNVKCLYKAPCLLLCFIWELFIFYLLRDWVWKTPVCATGERMHWPGKPFWSVLLILWYGVWGEWDWQCINIVKTILFLSNGLGIIQVLSNWLLTVKGSLNNWLTMNTLPARFSKSLEWVDIVVNYKVELLSLPQ